MAPYWKLLLLLSTSLALGASSITHKYNADDPGDKPKLWAFLVAGSHIYDNYRHQADICHAYHVLHNHGIPEEQIVVMMYDDIANSTYNPTPGIIINHPDGEDVYAGVPKDYTRHLVTPQNFLDILQGKKVIGGSGKVIASGPNDHIFINFADHGAPGLIAFPHDELHARPFINVIKKMHKEKKFAKMVIYIEACESGSMFDDLLPENVDVFATTAANTHESSYACYWDEKRQVYLGDLYSVNWMEDSDREDLRKESLNDQFSIVKKETNMSHVMVYGDPSIGKLSVSEFQGDKAAKPIVLPKAPHAVVSSRDVPVASLRNKLAKAMDVAVRDSLRRKLQRVLRNRFFLKEKVTEIADFVTQGKGNNVGFVMKAKTRLTNFDCYENVVRYFSDKCFKLSKNPYALEHLRVFVNLCESGYKSSEITQGMDMSCTHPTVVDIV
uniref:legumain n=1 Tax=Amblyomma maculatum TaxID=34609 RepID=G3MM08_AMBMU